jgi:hypothetical protein
VPDIWIFASDLRDLLPLALDHRRRGPNTPLPQPLQAVSQATGRLPLLILRKVRFCTADGHNGHQIIPETDSLPL